MKKITLAVLNVSAIFVVILVLSNCAPNKGGESTAKMQPSLRVGISTNAPPLAYKVNGKIQGLEADFAAQLATYLGKKLTLVSLPWEKQIPALEAGKIDIIMSGMTITPKRLYRVAFTKPYLRSGQILLVRANEARRYSGGIYSLMGDKPPIGVVENTTGDFFVTKTINRPDLTRFKTSRVAVEALKQGDIDALIHDAPILCYYAAMNEGQLTPILQMATQENLAWAVNKMNNDLLMKVNQFIDEQTKTSGIKTTVKRWIPYMQ